VTDPWLHANGPVAEIAGRLQDAGIAAAVHDGVQPDPTTDDVRAGVRVAREHEAEGVVAVGGGSPIDGRRGVQQLVGLPGARHAPDRYASLARALGAAPEAMAQAALASGSPDFNPRRPSEQEIVDLYREVY
jgi:alcohol dehydrogenase class IV